jgi:hypothetical protein
MKIAKSFAVAAVLVMATAAFADDGQTVGSGGATSGPSGGLIGSGTAVPPSGGYLGSGNIVAAAEDCRGQMVGSGGRADCGPMLGSGGVVATDECRGQTIGSGGRVECITGNTWADLFLLFLLN